MDTEPSATCMHAVFYLAFKQVASNFSSAYVNSCATSSKHKLQNFYLNALHNRMFRLRLEYPKNDLLNREDCAKAQNMLNTITQSYKKLQEIGYTPRKKHVKPISQTEGMSPLHTQLHTAPPQSVMQYTQTHLYMQTCSCTHVFQSGTVNTYTRTHTHAIHEHTYQHIQTHSHLYINSYTNSYIPHVNNTPIHTYPLHHTHTYTHTQLHADMPT